MRPHSPHCVCVVDGALPLAAAGAGGGAGATAPAGAGATDAAADADTTGVGAGGAIGAATIGTAMIGPATGPEWLLLTFIVLACSLNTKFMFHFLADLFPHHMNCRIHGETEKKWENVYRWENMPFSKLHSFKKR